MFVYSTDTLPNAQSHDCEIEWCHWHTLGTLDGMPTCLHYVLKSKLDPCRELLYKGMTRTDDDNPFDVFRDTAKGKGKGKGKANVNVNLKNTPLISFFAATKIGNGPSKHTTPSDAEKHQIHPSDLTDYHPQETETPQLQRRSCHHCQSQDSHLQRGPESDRTDVYGADELQDLPFTFRRR